MTLQEQIRANRWRTLWLLFLFAGTGRCARVDPRLCVPAVAAGRGRDRRNRLRDLQLALRRQDRRLDTSETKHASRAVAHLYVENPLNQASGFAGSMRGLFDTHPPLEARIAALEEAGGFKLPPV
jgi:hypothetical protein